MKWIIIKNNWKKFKWRYIYSKKKRIRILGSYRIDMKSWEDDDGNYHIDWSVYKK